jgi:hypothetical protein
VGGTAGGGGVVNALQLFTYDNGAFASELLRATPPVAGQAGLLSFQSAAQAGVAQIALGGTDIVVPNTLVSASSVILCTALGADATAFSVRVSAIVAGTSFTIETNAATTAAYDVAWFIVRQ